MIGKKTRQDSHSVFQKFLHEQTLKLRSSHTHEVLPEIFCDIVLYKHMCSYALIFLKEKTRYKYHSNERNFVNQIKGKSIHSSSLTICKGFLL